MADVVAKPAEHTFVFHEEYQLEEFRSLSCQHQDILSVGVSLVFPDAHLVLTGDALFRETIGRTDLPTGSMEQLLHSIQTQLFTLPNYDVYPGHGPATTIAHEKTFNPFSSKRKEADQKSLKSEKRILSGLETLVICVLLCRNLLHFLLK